jgi:hypothetical protein
MTETGITSFNSGEILKSHVARRNWRRTILKLTVVGPFSSPVFV